MKLDMSLIIFGVLVPFYRGAVVFELVDSISFWVDEMNKMRPNDNMKIIEGELL